jgi:hypothetical protein
MSRVSGHFRSAEERKADHERWVADHYLEPGRAYTYEANRLWDTTTDYGRRVYSFHVSIRQAESPWSFCVTEGGFLTRAGAEHWARAYIARGGPDEEFERKHFGPRVDPNRVIAGGSRRAGEAGRSRTASPGLLRRLLRALRSPGA